MSRGSSFPLGATPSKDGVNFSLFAKGATGVELLLFDRADSGSPSRSVVLDPERDRSYHYWHTLVPGLRPGQIYAYRVDGPFDPPNGVRFNREKVLLDPYGTCLVRPGHRTRAAAAGAGDNAAVALKSVVADLTRYDWEEDAPPHRPFEKTVIYEMHVGAFTRHPNSGVAPGKRGTFAGLIEKIPYLVDLGVSAVELLPVFAFDEQDAPAGLPNDWGYQPVSFFAPHQAYSSRPDPLDALDEFRDMVKALHRAGIEVILDVVFNHTAEGNADGPTICFRGLANSTYYILDEDNAGYADYSGCGNTLNANDPVVRRLIVDSLRHWVSHMHVDGFRFDLASILARDPAGRPMASPPVLWDIESDPVLANVKLIAEAWDAAGLYQVGSFVGDSWKEWNGRFRDDVRSFLKGDGETVRSLASRLVGSPDLYEHKQREPEQSINFVTCHDGFTLNDLLSYNQKRNEANGENNRDGTDDNRSWNCGVEGPSDDPEIERLRMRQAKNFITLLLIAVGTPMLLMGDEVRRTQRGNNNAYCQDGELSWFDWSLVERHADLRRFTRMLIGLRMNRQVTSRASLTLTELLRHQPVTWHGVRLNEPDWGHDSHTLAGTVSMASGARLQVIVNAYWEPLTFAIPSRSEGLSDWQRVIDTSLEAPNDICQWSDATEVKAEEYVAGARSVVLLRSMPLQDRQSS